MNSRTRLAVLIDAENVSHKRESEIFAQITLLGQPEIRVAFGDWSTSRLEGWKEVASERAIRLECQLPCTQHKNGSDIALAVEAMDLLHLSRPDGFVIVSGDSDFTPLVTRLRERLRPVYMIGGANTSRVLRAACTEFFVLKQDHGIDVTKAGPMTAARSIVAPGATVKEAPVKKAPVKEAPVKKAPVKEAPVKKAPVKEAPVKKAPVKKAPAKEAPVKKAPTKKAISTKATRPPTPQAVTAEFEARLRNAIKKSADTDGWASLSVFGEDVGQDIRPKDFGHATWIKLFTGRKGFQIRKKPHAAVRSTA